MRKNIFEEIFDEDSNNLSKYKTIAKIIINDYFNYDKQASAECKQKLLEKVNSVKSLYPISLHDDCTVGLPIFRDCQSNLYYSMCKKFGPGCGWGGYESKHAAEIKEIYLQLEKAVFAGEITAEE